MVTTRIPASSQSGWGREMGHEVLNNYTEVKAVTTQL
jgi:phenylacetaldehyde dehydrogenase